jgi:hypothetical protein
LQGPRPGNTPPPFQSPAMVVEFNQNVKGFSRGEKAVVVGPQRDDPGAPEQRQRYKSDALAAAERDEFMVLKSDGSVARLPVEKVKRFDVYRPSELKLGKGDRIRITKNGEAKIDHIVGVNKMVQAKGTSLNNGDIFTVEGFTKEGDIRLEKGKLLPKNWAHMTLGYVDTSYSSQGKTVDRVFIAAGNESLPATNQQQWYVSASRGREQAKLYVDSKEDVRNAISRTGQRLSAVELTHTKLRSSWHHRFYKSLSQNRVSRFLSQRAAAIAQQWHGKGQEAVSYA